MDRAEKMIVRVQGSGQYRLEAAAIPGLNQLDTDLQKAVDQHDEKTVTTLLFRMITYVQGHGVRVPDEEIVPSDAILPPDTLSYEEIVALLREDGLVPG